MPLSGSKPRTITALEVDFDVARMVVMERAGKGWRARTATARIPGGVIQQDAIQPGRGPDLTEALRPLLAEAGAAAKFTALASPDRFTILSRQELPPLKGRALHDVVQQKAATVTRFEANELRVGFVQTHANAKEVAGILAAINTAVVTTLTEAVKDAAAVVMRMEPRVFSLTNALWVAGPENDQHDLTVLVHLSHARAAISVVRGDTLLMARYASAGEERLNQGHTYRLLTQEINDTLQEFRRTTSKPIRAFLTGRLSDHPGVREAVGNADVDLQPRFVLEGVELPEGDALETYATGVGLCLGRLA